MTDRQDKSKIKSFTDLVAWQESHKLVLMVYKISDKFPSKENFGLTSQIKRAAVSVSSNIAEGFSRNSNADKAHFYTMAMGSLTELQNQILVARDVNYISQKEFLDLANQSVIVSKLINGLKKVNFRY
ncbi:MAG: S23 ribosomal protein [Microgenomates group bacterium GW2011_GWA1_Microgenomates_45_10]|uniref:Four helix bundle protein n=1 Tax=Candidatus Yanofskybacteria bacterium RIFCSPHIGHO2_01_FULL_48_25b TaxID=1802672 RepID=A0A1F8F0M6_9BACT|nr:MAG: S23 ribosomal protein [Microgenomates group bacterium GW2011_GWA1_Microgenomates_45_10]OGN06691.1 MAG: hypothetical protein A2669_00495 [Candidatus Yanofskybacteria bacterium RIFCSPHIGHO2_01_FULL_48_25b]